MSGPFNQDGDGSTFDNGQSSVYPTGQEQGTNFNPAFQPILNEIPQDLHGKIIPTLQEWDKGYNKLQSEYAPWKEVVTSGATPDMVRNGLGILNMLERDPQSLYNILKESYKFDQPETAPNNAGQGQVTEPDPYDVRYRQLENNFQTLAQHVLTMRQQEQQAQADAMIRQEFDEAHKKYGKFDDNMVRNICIANPEMSVGQAAEQYLNWYRGELAKHGARPIIEGASTGGLPSNNIDVTKMSGQDARKTALQMMQQMKRAANGY